jgi:hypothetical protein
MRSASAGATFYPVLPTARLLWRTPQESIMTFASTLAAVLAELQQIPPRECISWAITISMGTVTTTVTTLKIRADKKLKAAEAKAAADLLAEQTKHAREMAELAHNNAKNLAASNAAIAAAAARQKTINDRVDELYGMMVVARQTNMNYHSRRYGVTTEAVELAANVAKNYFFRHVAPLLSSEDHGIWEEAITAFAYRAKCHVRVPSGLGEALARCRELIDRVMT